MVRLPEVERLVSQPRSQEPDFFKGPKKASNLRLISKIDKEIIKKSKRDGIIHTTLETSSVKSLFAANKK